MNDPLYDPQNPFRNPPGSEGRSEQPAWPPEGSQSPYASPQAPGGRPSSGRSGGTASLICGLFSILMSFFLCCCGVLGIPVALVGIGVGVAALLVGNKELAALRAEGAPPQMESTANAGRICGIVGIVLNSVAVLVLIAALVLGITLGALSPRQNNANDVEIEDVFE